MSSHTNLFALAAIVALIAFSLYRRVRRLIGRQRLRPTAMTIRMGVFALLCLLLMVWPQFRPLNAAYDILAGVLGVGLGYYALKKTAFERASDGAFYYKPHAYVGAGLIVLFVGRIAYRFLAAYPAITAAQAGHPPSPPPDAASTLQNPLTVAFYFALAGYYVSYYAGILREAQRESAAPQVGEGFGQPAAGADGMPSSSLP
jgi:Protein of unknown function (DUF1453)